MSYALRGPTCEKCSRPGHNPPVYVGALCARCWHGGTVVERRLEEAAQRAADRDRESDEAAFARMLAEIEAL